MATDPDTTPAGATITDLRAVVALLEKPELVELYRLLREEPTTIPDVLPSLGIGKTTAYDYVDQLEQAGLVEEVGTRETSTVYGANDFSITVTVGDEKLDVSPAVVRVLAERTSNPEVDRFVDQYGIATLVEFIDLAHRYAEGKMTHRAIAEVLDVSRAAAFDMLDEVLTILDIVPESTHSKPGDHSDEDVEWIVEKARESE